MVKKRGNRSGVTLEEIVSYVNELPKGARDYLTRELGVIGSAEYRGEISAQLDPQNRTKEEIDRLVGSRASDAYLRARIMALYETDGREARFETTKR